MTSGDSHFLWIAGMLVLVGLAWLFAVYLCFTKYRENPRGTVFLGIAILLEITLYGLGYLPHLALPEDLLIELYNSAWYQRGLFVLQACFKSAIWVMIALAVFARRPDQYADLS